MSKGQYKFVDYLECNIVSVLPGQIKDDYMGALKAPPPGTPHPSGLGTTGDQPIQNEAPAAQGLVVKIAATHAGLVTRNNGFYLPDRMRKGVDSWVEPYKKPMQVHHEDHSDPIGRVISARYVSTLNTVEDRFKNYLLKDHVGTEHGKASAQFWKDFVADGSIESKARMIRIMDNVLSDPMYPGVGYIELTVDITDPEAQQKVLDGRYLTVSVGATSDSATCSVCDTDWVKDGRCEHSPGKIYDGKRCLLIAGNLDYDECSYVNTPADRHARNLEIGSHGLRDYVSSNTTDGRTLYFVPKFSTDRLIEEVPTMADGKENTEEVVEDSVQPEEEVTAEVATEVNNEDAGAHKDSATEDKPEESVTDDPEAVRDSADESTIDTAPDFSLLDKVFVDKPELTEEESSTLYDMLVSEMDETEVKDAKLKPEQRKKLPRSSFCGPGRSFPVNDCAHYTAAKRLLNRYKGEGDKSKILACIERKGKALGCPGATKKDSIEVQDSVNTEADKVEDGRLTTDVVRQLLAALDTGLYGDRWSSESQEEAPVLDDSEAQELRNMIASLTKRIGKDNFSAALVDLDLAITKDMEDSLVSEVEKNEEAVGALRDQLSALRKELSAVYDDVNVLEDQLIEARAQVRDSKLEQAQVLYTLQDSWNDDQEASLKDMSTQVLDETLKNLHGKVDIKKISDKINDGCARAPDETVDSPVPVSATEPSAVTDQTPETPKHKPTFESQKIADQVYRHLMVEQRNPEQAKRYYTDMVNKGYAAPAPHKMLATEPTSEDNKEE